MGVQRLLAIVPLVLPAAQAQNAILDALKANAAAAAAGDATTTENPINAISAAMGSGNDSTATATTTQSAQTVAAPDYEEEQCDSWISVLAASDGDASGGLSGEEYLTFLSGITDPPYVGAYFQDFSGYSQLPWTFRVIHKTLACHCEQLDMGPQCCKGAKAEVLVMGLGGDATAVVPTTRDTTQTEYRDMFCQHIAYALSRSVPSPAPTQDPAPIVVPVPEPVPEPVTPAPVTPGPSASPIGESTAAPVVVEPAVTPAPSLQPTPTPPAPAEVVKLETVTPPEDDGLGTGGIIGIIAVILIAVLAVIAMVAYRRKMERDRLRRFAGDQAPEGDLEAPPPSMAMDGPGLDPQPTPAKEPRMGEVPEEDDESSAPSVWSESDHDDEDGSTNIHDANEGEDKVTAGSALAAMGAASTVAANLMNTDGSGRGGVV